MNQTVDQGTQTTGSSVAAASGGLALLSSLSNLSSPQGLWMSMNQFQLIIMTLLTNAYTPKKVVDYLAGMKTTTCSFGFLPFKKIPGFDRLVQWFDYDIKFYKLDYFGVESGSAFVNIFSLACILALIVFFHIFFLILYKAIYNKPKSKPSKCMGKTWFVFSFMIYIRLILQSSQFMILASYSELVEFDTSADNTKSSIIVSG